MPNPRSTPRAAFRAGLLTLAALTMFAIASLAQAGDDEPADVSGTYTIEGTFDNGKDYTGTLKLSKKKSLELRKGSKFVSYDLKIKYSTDWEGVGIGTLIDGRFYFAMAKQGKYFTVAVYRPTVLGPEVSSLKQDLDAQNAALEAAWARGKRKNDSFYEVKGDPWYVDVWNHTNYGMFFQYSGDWGTEGLGAKFKQEETPVGEGTFSWHSHYYDDHGKDTSALTGNSGKIEFEKQDNGCYKVVRHIWQNKRKGVDIYDEGNDGIALMPDASTMVAAYAGDGSEGVGYFDIHGKVFEGRLCDTSDAAPYTMKATPPDNVIAKNPGLFK